MNLERCRCHESQRAEIEAYHTVGPRHFLEFIINLNNDRGYWCAITPVPAIFRVLPHTSYFYLSLYRFIINTGVPGGCWRRKGLEGDWKDVVETQQS
jgi:hypothetical protein